MKKHIDLSHTIDDKTITYKGLPAPIICDYLSREEAKNFYADGAEFQIGKIEMVANTGTYLDCPFHRFEDGEDISEVLLDRLVDLDAVLVSVDVSDNKAIGKEAFEGIDCKNKAILIKTDWSKHWGTDQYFEDGPYLTKQAAEYLKSAGAKLVGIDCHNIDNTTGNDRPVHTILLGEGILIVEHLCNLDKLIGQEFSFTAAPPKIKGMGTFPVRAFATVN